MIIKKGTKLRVEHQRKGQFYGEAYEDFDTEKDEWYPIRAVGHVAVSVLVLGAGKRNSLQKCFY